MMDENKLDDVWFIGGGDQIFLFTVYDRFDEPLDLREYKVQWALSYMGYKDSPILLKDNKTTGGIVLQPETGVCMLTIPYTDTLSLESNKYEQELILTHSSGRVLRPVYGFIDIRKGVQC